MNNPRRVAVITGTRAEYGLLRPVIRQIEANPDLEAQVIVAGMHLMRRFGYTVEDVLEDGIDIAARVPMHRGGDDMGDLPECLARGVTGFGCALQRLDSDIVVVLGDRIEALAAALATVTSGRYLAHIHGGDVAPGHLDDTFRHAITKLAHVHFAACTSSAKRIKRLGEDPQTIHSVGAPGLDELIGRPPPESGWLQQHFELDPRKDVAIVLQHPTGRSAQQEAEVMQRILRATLARKLSCVVIHPNCDSGHSGILQAIESAVATTDRKKLVSVASLPRDVFLNALMAARLLVGNSSCGVIEAHTLGTAAVNIGDRQQGRQCNSGSVVHCAESLAAIRNALKQALELDLKPFGRSVYGNGHAAESIVCVLDELQLSDNPPRKTIHY